MSRKVAVKGAEVQRAEYNAFSGVVPGVSHRSSDGHQALSFEAHAVVQSVWELIVHSQDHAGFFFWSGTTSAGE